MIERGDLQELAATYGDLTQRELEQRRAVAEIERRLKETRLVAAHAATEAGKITGKNAPAREAQLAAILAEDKSIAALQEMVKSLSIVLFVISGKRAAVEAEIKLTTAWLYSQARIG